VSLVETYSQLILDFAPRDAYNPDQFIVSSCNQEVYNYLTDWVVGNRWGVIPYSYSLVISGPKNSGKTFVAKIWAMANNACILPRNLKYFDYDLLKRYNCFVMDDIDFSQENDILHVFNIINEHRKYLLLCVEKMPEIKLPDLRSRLLSLNSLKIHSPDDDLIGLLLQKLFASYSVTVKQEVINYLLNHLERDFFSITNFARNINLYSLRYKQKITIPLIKKYFIQSGKHLEN